MRHRMSSKHFGRDSAERRALARSLVVGLLVSPSRRIVTTVAKAKWVRGFADRVCCRLSSLETVSDDRRLAAIRGLADSLGDRAVLGRVMRSNGETGFRRSGGNVRVVRLATPRLGDAGPTAVLEIVGR